MIEWLARETSISLWQLLIIAIYVVIAHSYVTYRLAQSDELPKIWLKLKRVISMLPLPMKPCQNQRIHNKANYPYDNVNGHLRNVEDMQNQINDNRQRENSDKPSHNPFHADTLPHKKKDNN